MVDVVWSVRKSTVHDFFRFGRVTKDIMYLIICPKCEDSYIGQIQNLRNRVTLPKQEVRHEHYKHIPLSKHLPESHYGEFKISNAKDTIELKEKVWRNISSRYLNRNLILICKAAFKYRNVCK